MGPYLSAPKTQKEYDSKKGANIGYCAASMQGWRNSMEDTHIADLDLGDDTSVFGVFDGHGGSEVSLFVRDNFIRELKNNANFKSRTNLEEALRETFIQMDRIMITREGTQKLFSYRESRVSHGYGQDLSAIHAGCTANVALVYKNQLYVANSGDSRSVLSSKDEAFPMSYDHKPEDEKELARVHAAGGFVAEGRINGNLNLSRAMGDFSYKGVTGTDEKKYCDEPEKALISVVPDVKKKVLAATDRFLLMGCDGIWECKSNQELIDFVGKRIKNNEKLEDILTALLNTILAKDCSQGIGCDNMTVMIVLFGKQ